MKHLALALAALLHSAPASAQVYGMCAPAPGCKVWYGTTTTTTTTGAWSVSFPPGTFSTTPQVTPQPVSADATIANSAQASLTSQSPTGASGVVTIPAAVVVGGMPVKAAGAGIVVDVVAVGY